MLEAFNYMDLRCQPPDEVSFDCQWYLISTLWVIITLTPNQHTTGVLIISIWLRQMKVGRAITVYIFIIH